jgi:2',3'-cyclic-nucleotide 2'-phosphodiesterase (5'-nucleotidase family)
VALSHLGLRADRALAAAVPQLDLILGGHSHDTTPEPEVVNGVPIVHAGPYGAFASRTELVRDGARARITAFDLLPLT